MGFSDLGVFGGEINTPVLDKLALDGGVRFNQFYAAPACSPTRSMILSGTDNHLAGVGEMFEIVATNPHLREKPGHEGHLSTKVAALPEILSDAGYHTIISGKWHLGLLPDVIPSKRGFQKSFSLLPGCANHYGWEPQLTDEDEKELNPLFKSGAPSLHTEGDRYVPETELPKNFYSTDFYASKLIEYLNEVREENKTNDTKKPFFAYLPFTAPHWPLQAPRQLIDKYKGVYDEGPEVLREKRLQRQKELGLIPQEVEAHPVVAPEVSEWGKLSDEQRKKSARAMEAYAAMVESIDINVGRVLDDLKAKGELDNTVVVFLSDNGAEGASLEAIPLLGESIEKHIAKFYNNSLENIGNHDSYVWYGPRWAQAATAPSKLYKTFTSEGGIHVPFILSYPKIAEELKGTIASQFSTVMDLAPTFLELAGIPQPNPKNFRGKEVHPIRGKSWVKFLKNPNSVENIHDQDDTVGWGLFGGGALRKGDWKITFIRKPVGNETWGLFNIKNDPAELHDLSKQEPAKYQELLEEWKKYVAESQVVGLANEWENVPINEIDDETLWMKYERVNAYDIKKQVKTGVPIKV
ncbi:hypothetical protein D0Z00_000624 [Geotrichum galactomycetum]|uniref:Uncharacterized protein n=1 Tax=Geotrichum galactomycetum TaxID=27317 RepID=A0ACB6V9E8_9ASCO|nr:hypothetical protein D0Z00_000624 [Geotrichum candidum]